LFSKYQLLYFKLPGLVLFSYRLQFPGNHESGSPVLPILHSKDDLAKAATKKLANALTQFLETFIRAFHHIGK